MCWNNILADLQRHYDFGGRKERKATPWGVVWHIFSPRFLPIIVFRMSHAFYLLGIIPIARVLSVLNFVLFGIEISMRCEIGPGLCLPHTVGTVIGALRIGHSAVIYHGATLGAKEMDLLFSPEARPVVGDNVVIGSGAKILGGITIGNNVVIGANAVVVDSVPQDVVVGGVPARIIRSAASAAPGSRKP